MWSRFFPGLGIIAALSSFGFTACRPGTRTAPSTSPDGGQNAAKAQYEIKLGHATANDAQDQTALFFGKEVERLSSGRIKVSVFNASQLGNNDKMNKDLRSGAQEALLQPTGFATAYLPILGVLDLPFLFPNDEVQTKVLNSDAAKPLLDAALSANVEIVAFFGGGFKQLATTFPVTKVEDLRGRKFRVISSPELVAQFKAFGAIGVPMALGEVYTALQQGTVEGVENPEDVVVKMKHHEAAKYFTRTNHGALSSVILVNKRFLSSLPADLQKAVRDAGQSAANKALELYSQARKDSAAEMARAGIQLTELPAPELAKLKAAAEPVWDEAKKDKAKAEAIESLTKAIAATR